MCDKYKDCHCGGCKGCVWMQRRYGKCGWGSDRTKRHVEQYPICPNCKNHGGEGVLCKACPTSDSFSNTMPNTMPLSNDTGIAQLQAEIQALQESIDALKTEIAAWKQQWWWFTYMTLGLHWCLEEKLWHGSALWDTCSILHCI